MSEKTEPDADDADLDKWLNAWPLEPEHAPLVNELIDGESSETSSRFPEPFQPESIDETNRNSGLAWSAGIAFFVSTTFTLFLGWGADLLLGTSPWGLVGGIILGSIIGFIQFFRITSQIFRPDKSKSDIRPLFGPDDDDDSPGV